MKTNEHDYYSELANWSFEDVSCTVENFTGWVYEDVVRKYITVDCKVLDLGTAAGEKVLKYFPHCAEILATDFSQEMIDAAKINLVEEDRTDIEFRVMDNLHMDTPDEYFDLVTARHTAIAPVQVYRTLKPGGKFIVRGVDRMDCWALKRLFGRGQAYHDTKPADMIDYESIMDAGFRNVELIPLHEIEYYKTKEDLLALLQKTPILDDISEEKDQSQQYERMPIEKDLLERYIKENTTPKGIRLIWRYYGIEAEK